MPKVNLAMIHGPLSMSDDGNILDGLGRTIARCIHVPLPRGTHYEVVKNNITSAYETIPPREVGLGLLRLVNQSSTKTLSSKKPRKRPRGARA